MILSGCYGVAWGYLQVNEEEASLEMSVCPPEATLLYLNWPSSWKQYKCMKRCFNGFKTIRYENIFSYLCTTNYQRNIKEWLTQIPHLVFILFFWQAYKILSIGYLYSFTDFLLKGNQAVSKTFTPVSYRAKKEPSTDTSTWKHRLENCCNFMEIPLILLRNTTAIPLTLVVKMYRYFDTQSSMLHYFEFSSFVSPEIQQLKFSYLVSFSFHHCAPSHPTWEF